MDTQGTVLQPAAERALQLILRGAGAQGISTGVVWLHIPYKVDLYTLVKAEGLETYRQATGQHWGSVRFKFT